MLYIDTKTNKDNHCGFYFGLEEYLIKDYDYKSDIFLLWSVVPTVMIGRHQITTVEIDQEFVKNNNIEVIRRNSGGGAVYTEPGCLQFSFITSNTSHSDIFRGQVNNIVNAVNKLGIDAKFTGRNDILANGKKFSGNAEYIYKDRMVMHGTILFNTNFDMLIGSLTPDKSKLTSHAISSVKARVINIGGLLDMNLDEFYDYMVSEIATSKVDFKTLDLDKVAEYSKKFNTDTWNYGKNPKYEISNKIKFDAGNIAVNVKIKNDIVKDLKITGDYFSLKKIEDFENAFIGSRYNYDSFLEILKKNRVIYYIYKLQTSEFLELFFEKKRKKRISKPSYLKIDMKNLNRETKKIRDLLAQHNLYSVCQEANCPNQLECFSNKTATFMILGNHCTRNCSFCDVSNARPLKVDSAEPMNILKAVNVMDLSHLVITSVTRDDLKDYGSKQFVKCIEIVRKERPKTTIEVLIPDFMGDYDSLKRVVDAAPDVINHNIETIERLYPGFRDRASYQRSLNLLKTSKEINPNILTKSGIMVGIGETVDEVLALMDDLRNVDCDIITIGQYLRPSMEHAEVKEYVSLETFDIYKKKGIEKGFRYTASGPLVRSSYQALKQFEGD
ncbi:MAG: lipoyl synthase [Candidatus Izimaplasma sp.]|nr:lipoyl synthase [Candidatus Izimaplasma bacterium]